MTRLLWVESWSQGEGVSEDIPFQTNTLMSVKTAVAFSLAGSNSTV